MRVSNYAICSPVLALLLVFDSTPSLAQDGGNALLKFERQGYANALGENDPIVQGFDKRMELQSLGFRNPDIRTSTLSNPSRSRLGRANIIAKKIADVGGTIDCYLGLSPYLWTPHTRVNTYLPRSPQARL